MNETRWPEKCSEVTWAMKTTEQSLADAELGDLVWQPKGGGGHVLVGEFMHQEGWEDPWPVPVCECGDVDMLDHHVFLMAKKPVAAAGAGGE